MRVLFCNIHCPSLICFCKPPPHIYSTGPLRLENNPHVAPTVVSASEVKEETSDDKQEVEVEEEEKEAENCPISKSSLKKVSSEEKEVQKKKVQWIDFLGKELAEIREFESNEADDFDYESGYNRNCVCIIL